MTTLTTLRDIERRLSEAKGPDREIDWAIWNAFDPAWPCDEFTANIDAAVALCERVLPDEPGYELLSFEAGGFQACVGSEMSNAPTAPLALCLALVRALISKAEAGE